MEHSHHVSRTERQTTNHQPLTTMSQSYPLETALRNRKTPITGVVEKEYKKHHDVYEGAPCEWAAERGATHTLYCGEVEGPFGCHGRGTRPARLLKTVLYVGVEEADDQIVWQKWNVRTRYTCQNA